MEVIGNKIKTLKQSLHQFEMPCLLEELDMKLELIRRNKLTEEDLQLFLKSIDKDLLKLSKNYHPDKAMGANKLDEEVMDSQNLQIALNATRTVLKALSKVFLKNIDVHYKYEFFANLDIHTLINEKQVDLEINNVLSKISHLSEIKRVNIVGEIRKFLSECQKCLRSFYIRRDHDFIRQRDNALHHLHMCIEGYITLVRECGLVDEDCRIENDENTRRVISKIRGQSQEESKILKDLEGVANRSLNGTFEIFPINEPRYSDTREPIVYKPVVQIDLEYLVSPFTFYVNVLLMCSVMVEKKSRTQRIKLKIGETLEYFFGPETVDSTDFINEPTLSNAFYLASYYNNNNRHYKEVAEIILKTKGHYLFERKNVREVFYETVKEIEGTLAKRFDIQSYKEGKSNQEQFNERLFQLNDSMIRFKEEEKKLREKLKLYELKTNEILKVNDILTEKTGQESPENPISGEQAEAFKDQQNAIRISTLPVYIPSCEETYHGAQVTNEQYQDIPQEPHDWLRLQAEETLCFKRDEQQKKYMRSDLHECVSNEQAEANDTIRSSTFPRYIPRSENTNHILQVVNDRCLDFPTELHEMLKVRAQKTPYFDTDQKQLESLSSELYQCVSNEQVKTEKVHHTSIGKRTSPDYSPSVENSNQTTQVPKDQCRYSLKDLNECLNVRATEIPCFTRDQEQKGSLRSDLHECISNEQAEAHKDQLNTIRSSTLPENIPSSEETNHNAPVTNQQCQAIAKELHDWLVVPDEETLYCKRDQQQNESLINELHECVSNEQAEAYKDQLNTLRSSTLPKYTPSREETNHNAQVSNQQCKDICKELHDWLIVHDEETLCFKRDQKQKESLSSELHECVSNEQAEADEDQQNTIRSSTLPEYIPSCKSSDQNAQVTNN